MSTKRRKYPTGLTFIEIMIATVILLIAVLGTSAFRYSTALSARKADLQATAARVALLLCESWEGSSDPSTFDPTQLSDINPDSALAIAAYGFSAEEYLPEGFAVFGTYKVTAEGVNYYALLSWKDIYPDLRVLNVALAWNHRGSETGGLGLDKSFRVAAYITN